MGRRRTKEELLEHYARCEPQEFLQIDGFYLPDGGDSFMHPDENGDTLFMSTTRELRRSESDLAVRVRIHANTRKRDALRLLAGIGEMASMLLMGDDDETVGEIQRRENEQSRLRLTAWIDQAMAADQEREARMTPEERAVRDATQAKIEQYFHRLAEEHRPVTKEELIRSLNELGCHVADCSDEQEDPR